MLIIIEQKNLCATAVVGVLTSSQTNENSSRSMSKPSVGKAGLLMNASGGRCELLVREGAITWEVNVVCTSSL